MNTGWFTGSPGLAAPTQEKWRQRQAIKHAGPWRSTMARLEEFFRCHGKAPTGGAGLFWSWVTTTGANEGMGGERSSLLTERASGEAGSWWKRTAKSSSHNAEAPGWSAGASQSRQDRVVVQQGLRSKCLSYRSKYANLVEQVPCIRTAAPEIEVRGQVIQWKGRASFGRLPIAPSGRSQLTKVIVVRSQWSMAHQQLPFHRRAVKQKWC
jgi:hypothetical protein